MLFKSLIRRRPRMGALIAGLGAFAVGLCETPAQAAGITGMWLLAPGQFGGEPKTPLPLTPEGQALVNKRREAQKVFGQEVLSAGGSKCLPSGVPGMMANEFAMEILETADRVTILNEASPLPRNIYLAEKTHPADLEPTWNGHSIGRFVGKTLMVDTVGFNDRAGPIGNGGVHSPTTHLTERFYLKNRDTLVGVMTFRDPKYLTKPWSVTHTYNRIKQPAELWEYVCEIGAAGWSQRYAGDPIPPKPQ